MSLAFALVGTLVLCGGCTQGVGDRCQVPSDCANGLSCAPTGSPGNGICQNSNLASGGNPGQDAAAPVATPDAASDVPTVAADAGGAPVAADGPSVGGDTVPDAEAADDSSVTD